MFAHSVYTALTVRLQACFHTLMASSCVWSSLNWFDGNLAGGGRISLQLICHNDLIEFALCSIYVATCFTKVICLLVLHFLPDAAEIYQIKDCPLSMVGALEEPFYLVCPSRCIYAFF